MFVAIPAPFDFSRTIERVTRLGPDRVNGFENGRLIRAIAGRAVAARAADGGVALDVGGETEAGVFRLVLGASFPVAGFERDVASDPVLGPLTRALGGLRPFMVPEPFEMLVTAITAQQISLHAALSVRNRIVERLGMPCGPVWEFPRPDRVADAKPAELRELGLSRSKASFVYEIARSGFDFEGLSSLADGEVIDRLIELPGVGRWTAEWFLARHLGRADIWPGGDLGLRRALERFYTDGEPVDEASARRIGEGFTPHRTLASAYLLAALKLP